LILSSTAVVSVERVLIVILILIVAPRVVRATILLRSLGGDVVYVVIPVYLCRTPYI